MDEFADDRAHGQQEDELDGIHHRLTTYAHQIRFEDLPAEVIRAAKVRVIDTFGALFGGFPSEACQNARKFAARVASQNGSTIIGTGLKTTPDMAAFVNTTTARFAELNDVYAASDHPGPKPVQGPGCHPSDIIMPTLAVAEYSEATGREFITSVVLGYEVYQRISDKFEQSDSFDHTNFSSIATAAAAGKLLRLPLDRLSHCISIAVVPNAILRQARLGKTSNFKATAPGIAGRAGVFAALMAQDGLEGADLPFEGVAGWCVHVARKRFSLEKMGGDGDHYKILDSQIKSRPGSAAVINPILAAEKVTPIDIKKIKHIKVEGTHRAKVRSGTDEGLWNLESRELADHSIPFAVASTLRDGTVTLRSYAAANLRDPELRVLMRKIEVMENEEFTKQAFQRQPHEYRVRISIVMNDGSTMVTEAGGVQAGSASQTMDSDVEKKFRGLVEEHLGTKQVDMVLDTLRNLESVEDVSAIPPAFMLA